MSGYPTTNECDLRKLKAALDICEPGVYVSYFCADLGCETVKVQQTTTIAQSPGGCDVTYAYALCDGTPILGPFTVVPCQGNVTAADVEGFTTRDCTSTGESVHQFWTSSGVGNPAVIGHTINGGAFVAGAYPGALINCDSTGILDRELVIKCTQAGQKISLQYDVETVPPTLLSAFNLDTNTPFVGDIADLIECVGEVIDIGAPINFCSGGLDFTRTDIFDAKTGVVIGSIWQDSAGLQVIPPPAPIKGECYLQGQIVISGPINYCVFGLNQTRIDIFNFNSGVFNQSIWQDDFGNIVAAPAPGTYTVGKCPSNYDVDSELSIRCDPAAPDGTEVLVQYNMYTSPPTVANATYLATGAPYIGSVADLVECDTTFFTGPIDYCFGGNNYTRTDIFNKYTKQYLSSVWQDVNGVVIPPPGGPGFKGLCNAPPATLLPATINTLAGANISVPAGLRSIVIVKTSGLGTVDIQMSNASVYTLRADGESFFDDANIAGLNATLPAYTITVTASATFKWHGTQP